jgi:GNAT superfamily N-acetyltransferase
MEQILDSPTFVSSTPSLPIVIDGIVYDVLDESELDSAILCLTATFTRGEPMTRELGITEREFYSFSELVCTKAVLEYLSVAARDVWTGRLVGCHISEDFAEGLIKKDDPIPSCFYPILALLEELDKKYTDKYPIVKNDLFHDFMVGVDKQYKGKNIGYHLVAVNNALGRAKGFRAAIAEVTGPASQHILIHKHHYQVLDAIPYNAFWYQQQPVFKGITSCENCQLVYKRFCPLKGHEEGLEGITHNAFYAVSQT